MTVYTDVTAAVIRYLQLAITYLHTTTYGTPIVWEQRLSLSQAYHSLIEHAWIYIYQNNASYWLINAEISSEKILPLFQKPMYGC